MTLYWVYLSSRQPASAPFYMILSLAGSILGSLTLYCLVRTGSGLVIQKKFPQAKLERVRPWLDRNGFVSVTVMSLLPPPAPFKLFLLAAGVFRLNILQFLAGCVCGSCGPIRDDSLSGSPLRPRGRGLSSGKHVLGLSSPDRRGPAKLSDLPPLPF